MMDRSPIIGSILFFSIIPTIIITLLTTLVLEVFAELVENTYSVMRNTADTVDNTFDIYQKTNFYLSVICNNINHKIPVEMPDSSSGD